MTRNDLDTKLNFKTEKPDCKIIAIIPAYNEDRFIGSVILKTLQYVHEVIVVDDGSEDHTAEVAKFAGATVLKHQDNLGKGSALNTGLSFARDLNPDAVIVMDADGQHDPAEIPVLAKRVLDCRNKAKTCSWCEIHIQPEDGNVSQPLEQSDIIIGSRYLLNESQVPKHRIFGHRIFNWFTSIASGIASTDSQSGFRAFSPKALEVLNFSSEGFSVESEMQLIAREHNLKITEAPITVSYHEKPKRNVIQHGLAVINGLMRLTGQYRPLLFFGLPGMIILLAGLIWGWRVVDIYRQINVLAVGYAMISVMLSIIGLVTLTTGIILHSIRGLLLEMLRNKNHKD